MTFTEERTFVTVPRVVVARCPRWARGRARSSAVVGAGLGFWGWAELGRPGLAALAVLAVLGVWLVPLSVLGWSWWLLVPPGLRRLRGRVEAPSWAWWICLRGWGDSCAGCGAPAEQVDHIRPCDAGGLNLWPNWAPLCQPCNRAKSNFWPGRQYRGFPGFKDPHWAAGVLRRERRRRWSPLWWLRVWFALVVR